MTMRTRQKNRYSLNGVDLKKMAMISMLIDHIGFLLIPPGGLYFLFRLVGRLAFPLYAFLLVEGFFHTRDLNGYKKNLLFFALISEIPFNLACNGTVFSLKYQNVFFTLFLGLCMMEVLQRVRGAAEEVLIIAVFAVSAWILRCDYQIFGILLILLFYWYRRGTCPFAAPGFLAAYMSLGHFCAAALSMIPISRYNGMRGRQGNKYLYYLFYPIHLLILYLISKLI